MMVDKGSAEMVDNFHCIENGNSLNDKMELRESEL